MARPRSSGYDEQRESILAAAAALFARRGYSGSTMQQVAAACGVSKATLYHYVRDKHELLAQIAGGHVARLQRLVGEVQALALPPEAHLRQLIERFTAAYASAQHEHRVLTEDVRFLGAAERAEVVGGQKRVVAAFADAIAALHPQVAAAGLATPMAMLLLGMINWTFTWLRPDGALTHQALAPIVSELFFAGLPGVAGKLDPPRRPRAARASTPRTSAVA